MINRKRDFSTVVNLLVFLLFCTAPVHAYIDPGSGSILVSGLIGLSVTLAYALRGIIYKFLSGFSGKSIADLQDFSGELVFFNEGRNYWNVFKPVLDELCSRNIKFIYLTADKDDPALKQLNRSVTTVLYIGSMRQSLYLLSRIKAELLVMTTPQLDILQLKRSKQVKHYCHLLHAPVDIHTYKKFAFDHFDSVLCTSRFQMENLRQLEADRNSRRKQLFETGCTYYDLIKEKIPVERDSVLIAPTWGDKSFFPEAGEKIIEHLLGAGHNLIYRPHPQSWISEEKLLKDIILKFSHNPNFSIDRSTDNTVSLSRAKVMICDFSGVIFDFVLTQNQPVIAVERQWPDGGYESSDIIERSSVYSLIDKAGLLVDINDLDNISELLNTAYSCDFDENQRGEFIFNFGKAGAVAANQILSLYEKNKIH